MPKLKQLHQSGATADQLPLFDGTSWVASDIGDLTADATPDGAADYVMAFDASAGAHKKVLMDDLPGGGGGSPQLDGGLPDSNYDGTALVDGGAP